MKCVLFLAAILIFFNSNGQGNLQFSRVLSSSGNLSAIATSSSCGTTCYFTNTTATSPMLTVPQGKVWKIELATPVANVSINGVSGINLGAMTTSVTNQQPFWLKAGDTFQFYVNSGTCNCCNCTTSVIQASATYFYSIIEFNIISN